MATSLLNTNSMARPGCVARQQSPVALGRAPLAPRLEQRRLVCAASRCGEAVAAVPPQECAASSTSATSTQASSTTQTPWGQGVRARAPLGAAALGVAAALAAVAPPVADAAMFSNIAIPGIVGDDPVREGLVQGFLLIFLSEIGDKTFFIALLLALQKEKLSVFAGTFGALAIMTVISVGLGVSLHQLDELLPFAGNGVPLDDILAVILLVVFGVQTLLSAEDAEEDAAEEKEEAVEAVAAFGSATSLGLILSTFTLVFAAEWGDKSFLATIALGAASSPLGVTGGAVAGHGVATAIAVSSGEYLSNYLSQRTVCLAGGSLFLIFAASTVFDIVNEMGAAAL